MSTITQYQSITMTSTSSWMKIFFKSLFVVILVTVLVIYLLVIVPLQTQEFIEAKKQLLVQRELQNLFHEVKQIMSSGAKSFQQLLRLQTQLQCYDRLLDFHYLEAKFNVKLHPLLIWVQGEMEQKPQLQYLPPMNTPYQVKEAPEEQQHSIDKN